MLSKDGGREKKTARRRATRVFLSLFSLQHLLPHPVFISKKKHSLKKGGFAHEVVWGGALSWIRRGGVCVGSARARKKALENGGVLFLREGKKGSMVAQNSRQATNSHASSKGRGPLYSVFAWVGGKRDAVQWGGEKKGDTQKRKNVCSRARPPQAPLAPGASPPLGLGKGKKGGDNSFDGFFCSSLSLKRAAPPPNTHTQSTHHPVCSCQLVRSSRRALRQGTKQKLGRGVCGGKGRVARRQKKQTLSTFSLSLTRPPAPPARPPAARAPRPRGRHPARRAASR